MHILPFQNAVVLLPEPPEFLAHDVIFPDLLVDDEKCGIDGKHRGKHNRNKFILHRAASPVTTGGQ